MPERIHFLSGLPRSGSTLLGSLLAQNPAVHVTPTSPLFPLLVAVNEQLNVLEVQYTFDKQRVGDRLYRALAQSVHADVTRPIVIDKHRGWPKHVPAIREFIDPNPRIIATFRPIAEVITSYLVLAERHEGNFIDQHLNRLGIAPTSEARAYLLWTDYLKAPYEALQAGMSQSREHLLLIAYSRLVDNPAGVLAEVREFCDLPAWEPDLHHVVNYCAEDKDSAWGLNGLHTIRPQIGRRSVNPRRYLPSEAIEYFSQFDLQVSV
jgi:sulfotransferase